MPPKKSPGTSKSKAAPMPKTQARTTRSKQTVNEEIEVQQGEKEQPINLEDEPNIHHITDQIKELREHGLELQTSVNDIRNHLVTAGNNHESLNSKLEDIVTYLQANPRHIDNSNTSLNSPHGNNIIGNTSASVLSEHLSWIDNDQTLLNNIVHGKMEVKDLLKLVPEEDRPKGRKLTHAGFLLDTSGTITTVDESTAFEKDFPQFGTIIYALSTYGAIRSLFDVDHTGIGTGIFIHVKNLTRWHHINGFPLGAVRSYFVAHFRKHQRSKDPSVWMNIDFELYANHIRHAAPQFLQTPRPPSPTKIPRTGTSADVCINFNTEGKGCTWGLCQRKHVCSTCGDSKHARHQCTKKSSSVKL
jgi:hypothetical protein